jgi:hypothetical protein
LAGVSQRRLEGSPVLLLVACQGEARLESNQASIEDLGSLLQALLASLLPLLLALGGRRVGIGEALRNGKTQGDRGGACRIKQAFHEVMSLFTSARSAPSEGLPAIETEGGLGRAGDTDLEIARPKIPSRPSGVTLSVVTKKSVSLAFEALETRARGGADPRIVAPQQKIIFRGMSMPPPPGHKDRPSSLESGSPPCPPSPPTPMRISSSSRMTRSFIACLPKL